MGHGPDALPVVDLRRVLASGVLSPEQQARLVTLNQQTNPRQLRREIYQALERLWAGPGVAEPAREAMTVSSR